MAPPPFSPIDQFIQLAHREKLPPTVIVSSVERALIYRMLNMTLSKDDDLYLKMVNYTSPIYPKKTQLKDVLNITKNY